MAPIHPIVAGRTMLIIERMTTSLAPSLLP